MLFTFFLKYYECFQQLEDGSHLRQRLFTLFERLNAIIRIFLRGNLQEGEMSLEMARGADQCADKGPSCRIRGSTSAPALGFGCFPRESDTDPGNMLQAD